MRVDSNLHIELIHCATIIECDEKDDDLANQYIDEMKEILSKLEDKDEYIKDFEKFLELNFPKNYL